MLKNFEWMIEFTGTTILNLTNIRNEKTKKRTMSWFMNTLLFQWSTKPTHLPLYFLECSFLLFFSGIVFLKRMIPNPLHHTTTNHKIHLKSLDLFITYSLHAY